MSDHFYTQQEVADLLRVSIHAVRKWRATGRLSFIRIGKTILISDTDIAAFLDEHRVVKTA